MTQIDPELVERVRAQVFAEAQAQLQKEHERFVQAFDSACDYKALANQLQDALNEAHALGTWAAAERDQLLAEIEGGTSEVEELRQAR